MRRTIQVKRERALIDAKKMERARKIKEENRIRKGLISAVKNQPNVDVHRMSIEPSRANTGNQRGATGQSRGEVGDGGGFFVTQDKAE
mmetsp:Transcript_45015/g.70581  ORF Transcript_45015/g.70581 Transcript_45015/m.70581 type:complete len:88 (-) Transcript_45015:125-388(-)